MIEYVDVTPTFVDLAGGSPIDSLDGTSFLPVLLGKSKEHKQYVYGIHTTRGINNGSEYYGIRSIRSERFKYVMNLTSDAKFQNNITEQNAAWTSFWPTWVEKAKSDPEAKDLVQRYQHRPAEELYDVVEDPYEMNNLAQETGKEAIMKDLRTRLLSWMEQQGDLGQETEMEALEHKVSYLKKN